jgi:hypothetical protein
MGELANRIATADPKSAGLAIDDAEWTKIVEAIRVNGLEAALLRLKVDDATADFVRTETASLLLERETIAVQETMKGSRKLKLSSLLAHLPQDGRLQIITTNYDRLVELAAEMAGFKVDTKAYGFYRAPFSKASAPYAFCDRIEWHGKSARRVEQKVISLYKPHGSLDWILVDGAPYRSGFSLEPAQCLIITPGQNKYRAGYNQPFDMQRELANKAIDDAQRFLIIGYGFNDDHLETHLGARIRSGVPTVIMTRTLTANAQSYLAVHPNIMALEAKPTDDNSTIVHFSGYAVEITDQPFWTPDGFAKGVMGS